MTFFDLVTQITNPNTWYIAVGVLIILLLLIIKSVFKGLKWAIFFAVLGLLIFFGFGKLFGAAFDSEPVDLNTKEVQKGAVTFPDLLYTKALDAVKR
ncbi:MAG: hypothetical protein WD200_04375 [Candidatus Andersenbacteria bacterium]